MRHSTELVGASLGLGRGTFHFSEPPAETNPVDSVIRLRRPSPIMFTRTKADEMLRGTTPSSSPFGAATCGSSANGTPLPYATREERVQGHSGNLDQIQKPAFRW